jgi:hypothetical protein
VEGSILNTARSKESICSVNEKHVVADGVVWIVTDKIRSGSVACYSIFKHLVQVSNYRHRMLEGKKSVPCVPGGLLCSASTSILELR